MEVAQTHEYTVEILRQGAISLFEAWPEVFTHDDAIGLALSFPDTCVYRMHCFRLMDSCLRLNMTMGFHLNIFQRTPRSLERLL